MTDIRVQRLRRRISDAVSDIDAMKAELADIRAMCTELSEAMRQIRERSPLPPPSVSSNEKDGSASKPKKANHLRRVI